MKIILPILTMVVVTSLGAAFVWLRFRRKPDTYKPPLPPGSDNDDRLYELSGQLPFPETPRRDFLRNLLFVPVVCGSMMSGHYFPSIEALLTKSKRKKPDPDDQKIMHEGASESFHHDTHQDFPPSHVDATEPHADGTHWDGGVYDRHGDFHDFHIDDIWDHSDQHSDYEIHVDDGGIHTDDGGIHTDDGGIHTDDGGPHTDDGAC